MGFLKTKSTFYLSGDNHHLILIELVYYYDENPLNSARGNPKKVMDYQTTNKLRYLFDMTNSKILNAITKTMIPVVNINEASMRLPTADNRTLFHIMIEQLLPLLIP